MAFRGRGGFRGGPRGGGGGGFRRPQGAEVTTKLFVGNIPPTATKEELVAQFEKFGRVAEADIVSNYAFVHYANEEEAVAAKNGMHGFLFQGNEIRVELSKSRVRQKPGMGSGEKCFRCGKEGHWSTECPTSGGSGGGYRGGGSGGGGGGGSRGGSTTKLFIGNLPESATNGELEELFSKHGKVVEADVLQNFGFVHFSTPEEAEVAVSALNQSIFKGQTIKVELSRSVVRQKPGMGSKDECYRCGSSDHWSKDCPRYPQRGRGGGGGRGAPPRGRPDYRRDYSPEPYYRDRYMPRESPRDRYSPYPDPYARRREPAPPPLPSRNSSYSRDPYERPPPDYYSRRSPERDDGIDEYAKRRADEAYLEFYKYYAGRRREAPPPPSLPPSGYDEPRLPPRARAPSPPLIGSRPIPQQSNYTDFSGMLNNLITSSM